MKTFLQENDPQINLQVQEPRDEISKSLSEASKIDFKAPSPNQHSNNHLIKIKGLMSQISSL